MVNDTLRSPIVAVYVPSGKVEPESQFAKPPPLQLGSVHSPSVRRQKSLLTVTFAPLTLALQLARSTMVHPEEKQPSGKT